MSDLGRLTSPEELLFFICEQEAEIERLRAALEQALEARPEDIEGILRAALDAGLPTAKDVLGIIANEQKP